MNSAPQMNLGTALVLGGVMFMFDLAGFIPIFGFIAGIAGFLTLKMYAYTSGVPVAIGFSAIFFKLAWPLSILPLLTLAVVRTYLRSSRGSAAAPAQAGPLGFLGQLTGRGSQAAGTAVAQTARGAGNVIRGGSAVVGGAVSAIPYVGAPLGAVIRTGGRVAGKTVETAGSVAGKTVSTAGKAVQKTAEQTEKTASNPPPEQTERKPQLQKPQTTTHA